MLVWPISRSVPSTRRDSTRVVHNLLQKAREIDGITQTQIVRRANLNFYAANRYIDRLVDENILRISVSGQLIRYHLTSEGERLLMLLDQVYSIIKV